MSDSKRATARDVAVLVSKRRGRAVTSKAVRSWVREHLAGYDKASHPEYQSHEYDAATVARIVAGMTGQPGRARAQTRAIDAPKASKASKAAATTTGPTDA